MRIQKLFPALIMTFGLITCATANGVCFEAPILRTNPNSTTLKSTYACVQNHENVWKSAVLTMNSMGGQNHLAFQNHKS